MDKLKMANKQSKSEFFKHAYGDCWHASTYIACYRDNGRISIPVGPFAVDKNVLRPKYYVKESHRPKINRFLPGEVSRNTQRAKNREAKRARLSGVKSVEELDEDFAHLDDADWASDSHSDSDSQSDSDSGSDSDNDSNRDEQGFEEEVSNFLIKAAEDMDSTSGGMVDIPDDEGVIQDESYAITTLPATKKRRQRRKLKDPDEILPLDDQYSSLMTSVASKVCSSVFKNIFGGTYFSSSSSSSSNYQSSSSSNKSSSSASSWWK